MPTFTNTRKSLTDDRQAITTISKGQQLKQLLQADIEKLELGRPFMSIRDICKKYNVSVYTAKSALSYFVEHGLLEHRQGSGTYRTNPISHDVANIGIVASHDFDPFTNLYYGEITRRVVQRIHERNLGALLLGQVAQIPFDDLVPFLRHRRVAGILLMGTFTKEYVRKVENSAFPAVLSEQPLCSTTLDYVTAESPQDSYNLTRFLIDQGHRRIAFLSYPEGDDIRLNSYRQALLDHGIEPQPQWIINVPKGDMWFGTEAAQTLIKQAPEVTAVFCKNDITAVGLIIGLKNLGINVPYNMSVVGFDGINLAAVTDPPITTVKVCLDQVGDQLCQLLYQRIHNPQQPQQVVKLSGELIVRRSTQKV